MEERFESSPKPTTATIAGKDLLRRIVINGRPDPRFLPLKEGGVFHYSPLVPFLEEVDQKNIYYSIVEESGTIVALIELVQNPHIDAELFAETASVDINLQGQKLSEPLLREMFSFAKSKGKKLKISEFTLMGQERLAHKIETLAKEYDVQVSLNQSTLR